MGECLPFLFPSGYLISISNNYFKYKISLFQGSSSCHTLSATTDPCLDQPLPCYTSIKPSYLLPSKLVFTVADDQMTDEAVLISSVYILFQWMSIINVTRGPVHELMDLSKTLIFFCIRVNYNLHLINLLKTFAPFKCNHCSLWTIGILVSRSFIQSVVHSHKHLIWFLYHGSL